MLPVLHIASWEISSHLILNILAFISLGIGLNMRMPIKLVDFSIFDHIDSVFYMLVGIYGGGWAAYTFPFFVRFITGHYVPANWWLQGTHWMGYVAGGMLAGYLFARKHRWPFWQWADVYAPLLALVLAIGRIGCFLAGDAFGRETNAWIGMNLPDVFGRWAVRYPTQIVSLIINLGLFAALLAFERYGVRRSGQKGWPFEGFLFLAYVELFCLQRFIFEFWRGDMPTLFGPFTWTHLYCVAAIVAASWAIVWGLHKNDLGSVQTGA